MLSGVDAVLVPGGFGLRGSQGKIEAVRFAREHEVPYFGICLGLQMAVVEFARNVVGLEGANSAEFDTDTAHPVIDLMEQQRDIGADMRFLFQHSGVNRGSQDARGLGPDEATLNLARVEAILRGDVTGTVADVPACNLEYCNAHADLRAAFCRGRTCRSNQEERPTTK